MGEQFCLRWNNHQSTVVSVVESLLVSESLTDCTLAAEGKELRAHKLILTACSPYFETVLCQHHNDKGHPIIILKDVKFYELKAMLDYMYKGEVNISQDQLDSFIKTAESLQIKGLTDQGGGTSTNDDSREMVSAPMPKRKPAQRPESPPAGAAPAREGSPSSKRRRRQTLPPQPVLQEEVPLTPAAPDSARLSVVPKVEPPDPLPAQQSTGPPVKSEMLDDTGPPEEIEDLTLDDDDDEDYSGMGDTSQPGTSFEAKFEGNTQASQDYSQWQMAGDRSTDEVFMAAQEAINQSNSQGSGKRHLCLRCYRSYKYKSGLISHLRYECGLPPGFQCTFCDRKFKQKQAMNFHVKTQHGQHQKTNRYRQSKNRFHVTDAVRGTPI